MNIVRWILALVLAALFAFMAYNKFLPEINGSENPVFPLLAKNTGIALLEPYFRWLTGALEIVTALLLIAPATRTAGASLGLMILVGALAAHFSPFLGIDIPGEGKFVFFLAVGMTVLNVLVLILGRGKKAHVDHARDDR